MIEYIVIGCSILGGLAAALYIYDKVRAVKWEIYKRKLIESHGSYLSKDAKSQIASRSMGFRPNFPEILKQAVKKYYPKYRLPEGEDIAYDWAEYFNPETFFPLMCRGKFTEDNSEIACFLMPINGSGFKVVVFRENLEIQPIELIDGNSSPNNLFIQTVLPGKYATVKGKGYGSFQSANIPKILRLKRQAVDFGQFGAFDTIFYWNPSKGRFISVPMSD